MSLQQMRLATWPSTNPVAALQQKLKSVQQQKQQQRLVLVE
jgi:hypothetical protein